MHPFHRLWLWPSLTARLIILLLPAQAQIAWTPIFVDGTSQIDLWTQISTGCPCPWNIKDENCACCVQDGGCHCGRESPNRCTQCGFEQHCSYMCNMTISSSELQKHSGKTFGQIKSPSLEGPTFCWFTFVPASSQRVEVQIYRLVDAGRFNGSSCIGGYIQLMNGAEVVHSTTDNHVCGTNERYSPPVVLFSDDDTATLLFQINEKTRRSQFLAYFSFTPINSTEGVGYHPRGGLRLPNTDCDWLYQDFQCNKTGLCVLASPNYPGLYPPHHQCKYHIKTSSEKVRIRVSFTSILLPLNQCKTDYIAIYRGSSSNSAHLVTLCANEQKQLDYPGPKLLIEFSSGSQIQPYEYNGFRATLQFYEKGSTTEPSVSSSPANELSTLPYQTEKSHTHPPHEHFGCEILFSGNTTRSGHFDTREYDWSNTCRLIFKGRQTDVVHITIFNYRLRSPACQSVIEIFNGFIEDTKGPVEKLCSPLSKPEEQKKFLSTANVLVVLLRRPKISQSTNEAEFVSGSYFFHDEQISGTMQTNSLCDVRYNGLNSPLAGMIDNPNSQQLYFLDRQLRCTQQFVPAVNQSVTIKLLNLDKMFLEPSCLTQCGDNGCRCSSDKDMQLVDHLMIVNEEGLVLTCMCGSYDREAFPVSVRSWRALTLVYSVANYTWDNKGFGFSASYMFNADSSCGDRIYTLHDGEIRSKNTTTQETLNHFYYQSCTWVLHSNVEKQLMIDISSDQNRPCTAWNISIHEYSSAESHHLGELQHTFCSREVQRNYTLSWKVNTVTIRLRSLSRTLPQFTIKWKSNVNRQNTRYGVPTASPNAISSSPTNWGRFSSLLCVPFALNRLYFQLSVR